MGGIGGPFLVPLVERAVSHFKGPDSVHGLLFCLNRDKVFLECVDEHVPSAVINRVSHEGRILFVPGLFSRGCSNLEVG
jgi:hypothetical protein